ncbi:hypothetical protein, partial [Enterocloster lavalensis]|uniref:hypothetical protein n=1 Tax=Enterocloster lavalensis TaxID=460384 RepID=UPI002FD9667C
LEQRHDERPVQLCTSLLLPVNKSFVKTPFKNEFNQVQCPLLNLSHHTYLHSLTKSDILQAVFS